jgi:hypothetical protein
MANSEKVGDIGPQSEDWEQKTQIEQYPKSD